MMVTIPIWVAIEVTPFGFLSKLYRNLSEDVKKHIAKIYYNVPYLYLESWLQTLSNVRNVCAHYGRLYNKKLTFKPRLFKEEMKQFDNGFAFAAIYIIQRLLTKDEGQRFITDLQALILEYEDSLEFSHIGFPPIGMNFYLKLKIKSLNCKRKLMSNSFFCRLGLLISFFPFSPQLSHSTLLNSPQKKIATLPSKGTISHRIQN
ncbi:hypothetical protein CQ056_19215 [Peribacillus simplex]|nr:hypothetical protein CQ056_19215 [Peribacillus simplex]